jgi:hypothetical protein
MDVIVIRDRNHTARALCIEKELIRHRRAKRCHFAIAEVREGSIPGRIGSAHGKHFAKLEVWNRYGVSRAKLRTILEPRERDIEITALY